MTSARTILRAVLGWPVASQHQARRNALMASTALAQRRRERELVEEFLAARLPLADEPRVARGVI